MYILETMVLYEKQISALPIIQGHSFGLLHLFRRNDWAV